MRPPLICTPDKRAAPDPVLKCNQAEYHRNLPQKIDDTQCRECIEVDRNERRSDHTIRRIQGHDPTQPFRLPKISVFHTVQIVQQTSDRPQSQSVEHFDGHPQPRMKRGEYHRQEACAQDSTNSVQPEDVLLVHILPNISRYPITKRTYPKNNLPMRAL